MIHTGMRALQSTKLLVPLYIKVLAN